MVILCNLAIVLVPTPGGSGAIEYSFITVYGSIFTVPSGTALASWAVLIYRILTYYLVMVVGLLVMLYDYLIGNKRAEQYKKTHLFKDGFIFKKKNKATAHSLSDDEQIEKEITLQLEQSEVKKENKQTKKPKDNNILGKRAFRE